MLDCTVLQIQCITNSLPEWFIIGLLLFLFVSSLITLWQKSNFNQETTKEYDEIKDTIPKVEYVKIDVKEVLRRLSGE